MVYITNYNSLVGNLLLASKNGYLIGLWIENQKYYFGNIKEKIIKKDNLEVFRKTKDWLERYFNGEKPTIHELKLNPKGTKFQKQVWQALEEIPYGKVTTYKEIAIKVATKMKKDKMSSQAVGNAIARNPIGIIIPCHRVIGTNGKLTGYAGGIEKKEYLLKHEKISIKKEK